MNVASSQASLHGVSEEEWQIRCDLAALYRLVAHYRMTDFIYTHLSARIPGPEHHFLINKYGVHFHEMRASDLVKIDLEGNIVEEGAGKSKRVNAAGFTIHSAIHMAREDLMCVAHTHTAAGIAVSAEGQHSGVRRREDVTDAETASAKPEGAAGRRVGGGRELLGGRAGQPAPGVERGCHRFT